MTDIYAKAYHLSESAANGYPLTDEDRRFLEDIECLQTGVYMCEECHELRLI